jgi:3-oxoacyl-[acyl-carrier protein] reductase
MAEDGVDKTALPASLLRGRVAIVTGGARGIGRATVLRLAEAGADVVINYARNEEAAEEVAHRAREFGVRALPLRADVSGVDQAAALVDRTVEQFGKVDLLVANAGIWEGAPVEELSEAVWDRVIDANLKGTWAACRAVVPFMKKQRRGGIVIVSSTAGQRGEAGYSNYAASKGGQISFTKALAVELAPEIRVNSVAPGWVDTDLNNEVFGDKQFKQKIVDGIPLQRVASADDVALSIVFLASDWAGHITGEILNVNGGAVLCG